MTSYIQLTTDPGVINTTGTSQLKKIPYFSVSSCGCLALLFLIITTTTTPATSSREIATIIGTRMATSGTSDSEDDTVTSGSEGDTVTSDSEDGTVTSGSEGGTVTSGSEGVTVTSGSEGVTVKVLQLACSWGGH